MNSEPEFNKLNEQFLNFSNFSDNNEPNDLIYKVLSFILIFMSLFPSIIIFLSFKNFKKRKTNEDNLIKSKMPIKLLSLLSFLVILILTETIEDKTNSLLKTLTQIQIGIFSVSILFLNFSDLKINYERYMNYYDPTFSISDIISKRSDSNFFQYLTFIISLGIYLLSNFFFDKKFLNEKDLSLYQNLLGKRFLISCNYLIAPFCALLLLHSLYFKVKNIFAMKNFTKSFNKDEKINNDISQRIKMEILNLLVIVFNFLYTSLSIYFEFIFYKNPAENFIGKIYLKTLSIAYLSISLIDLLFIMFQISRSDFYKFTLGNTYFSSFYCFLNPHVIEKPTISIDSSFTNYSHTHLVQEKAKELNSTNIYMHNNLSIPLDEIFVNNFDNTFNIILATLIKIFQNKNINKENKINLQGKNKINGMENPNNNNEEFNKKESNLTMIEERSISFIDNEPEIPSSTGRFPTSLHLEENGSEKIFEENEGNYLENQGPNGIKKPNTLYLPKSTGINNNTGLPNVNSSNNNTNITNTSGSKKNSTSKKRNSKKSNKKIYDQNDFKNLNNNMNNLSEKILDEKNPIESEYEFNFTCLLDDFEDEILLKLLNIHPTYDDNETENGSEKWKKKSQHSIQNDPEVLSSCNKKINYEDEINKILNIKVKEYFQDEFDDLLFQEKIDYKNIEKSFISHYNPQQKNFLSLFSLNIRDEIFKKQENLVFRTSDKLYNIEFLIPENDNLKEKEGEDSNLKKYINYRSERDVSFLPFIIGVFSIKVNSFKEIKVIISKNNLVEDIPKEKFNYWQLMKIQEEKKFQMITSSKDRMSLLVSDEILIKDDTKFHILHLKDFNKTIFNDLEFLEEISSNNFSLFVMYYETGKNSVHNSTNSLSVDDVKEEKKKERISLTSAGAKFNNNNISGIAAGFDSCFDVTLRNDVKMVEIKNGFQSNINEYNCLLFFLFDNIFNKKKSKGFGFEDLCKESNYEKFKNMVRNKFIEIR